MNLKHYHVMVRTAAGWLPMHPAGRQPYAFLTMDEAQSCIDLCADVDKSVYLIVTTDEMHAMLGSECMPACLNRQAHAHADNPDNTADGESDV